MSLINKMLQDLDARGGKGQGPVTAAPELKPVLAAEGHGRIWLLAGGGVLVLTAAGWFGWRQWQQHAVAPAAPVAGVPVLAVASPPPVAVLAAQAAPAAEAPLPAGGEAATPAAPAAAVGAVPANAAAAQPVAGRPARGATTASAEPRRGKARPELEASVVQELSPGKMAEGHYRRALVLLQEGRLSDALAGLERAVEIEPRHEAARQTLISLLLENQRGDDALRHLRTALQLDARQPALAMVLARLQIEKAGKAGSALETLTRSEPYALNNAEFQGMLAAVLQREQRHTEAADHYRTALRLAPQNGVWWIGLGISLQADKHLPEAREAFSRASATPGLTPELQAFLERKLAR